MNLKQSGFCTTYSFKILVSERKCKINLKGRESQKKKKKKKIYNLHIHVYVRPGQKLGNLRNLGNLGHFFPKISNPSFRLWL